MRNFAAAGLGNVYSSWASEKFDDGRDRALERLKTFQQKETDPRVRATIEQALKTWTR